MINGARAYRLASGESTGHTTVAELTGGAVIDERPVKYTAVKALLRAISTTLNSILSI
jgi:hypothetical protein